MSNIALIILGYLRNGEKSAYEMVKEFETWNLHYWLKISNPSIYKNIVKLCENGYLDSRVVKEGEMPEKTIYSVNEKGNSYYYELMEFNSKHIGNFYFDFNAFIVNVERLPEEKRIEYLTNFRHMLSECNKSMKSNYEEQHNHTEKPDSAFILIELYKDFYELLDRWSEKVLKHYCDNK